MKLSNSLTAAAVIGVSFVGMPFQRKLTLVVQTLLVRLATHRLAARIRLVVEHQKRDVKSVLKMKS